MPSVLPGCPSATSLAPLPSAIAPHLVGIGHPCTDAQAHRGIELSWRFGQSCGRHDERTFRLEVPRQRGAEDTGQQLTTLEWRDDKPTLTSTCARSAYTRRSMPAIHCVHDVRNGMQIGMPASRRSGDSALVS